jgi:hypothetical protein
MNTAHTYPTVTEAKAVLAKACQAHDAAMAELKRIGETVKTVPGGPPRTEAATAAVEAAAAQAQDTRAAHALGEVDQAAVKRAQEALTQAQRARESAAIADADARTLAEGIERRLYAAHQAAAETKAAVTRAENALLLAKLVEADQGYVTTATAAAAHFAMVVSCATALRFRDKSLLPAASASAAAFQGLPTIGPVSAEVVQVRTQGRQHGIRQMLIEPRDVMADRYAAEHDLLLDGQQVAEGQEQAA